jgi:hypothetical protein
LFPELDAAPAAAIVESARITVKNCILADELHRNGELRKQSGLMVEFGIFAQRFARGEATYLCCLVDNIALD